jgi:predicted flap endonuclease-1-like 5' DNA nuclease
MGEEAVKAATQFNVNHAKAIEGIQTGAERLTVESAAASKVGDEAEKYAADNDWTVNFQKEVDTLKPASGIAETAEKSLELNVKANRW